jgi:hypothetical protein
MNTEEMQKKQGKKNEKNYEELVSFLDRMTIILTFLKKVEKMNGIANPHTMDKLFSLVNDVHPMMAEFESSGAENIFGISDTLSKSDIKNDAPDKYFELIDEAIFWMIDNDFFLYPHIQDFEEELVTIKENMNIKSYMDIYFISESIKKIHYIMYFYIFPYINSIKDWIPGILKIYDRIDDFSKLCKMASHDYIYYPDRDIIEEKLVGILIEFFFSGCDTRYIEESANIYYLTGEDFSKFENVHSFVQKDIEQQELPDPQKIYPGLKDLYKVIYQDMVGSFPIFLWFPAQYHEKKIMCLMKKNIERLYEDFSLRHFTLVLKYETKNGEKIIRTTGRYFIHPTKKMSEYNSGTVCIPLWKKEKSNILKRLVYFPKSIPIFKSTDLIKKDDKTFNPLLFSIIQSLINEADDVFPIFTTNDYIFLKNIFEQAKQHNIPQPNYPVHHYKKYLQE